MTAKKPDVLTKGPSDLFDKAFEDANDLLDAEEQLKHSRNASKRSRLHRAIKKADAWLTRRTARHHEINKLTSQFIGLQRGEVVNIADLLNYLRNNGVDIVLDKSQGSGLTERAVRIHLRKAFGIEGKPGRKPS